MTAQQITGTRAFPLATDSSVCLKTLINEAACPSGEGQDDCFSADALKSFLGNAGRDRVRSHPSGKAEGDLSSVSSMAQVLPTHASPTGSKLLFQAKAGNLEIPLTPKKCLALLLWLKYCSYLLKRQNIRHL